MLKRAAKGAFNALDARIDGFLRTLDPRLDRALRCAEPDANAMVIQVKGKVI